MSSEKDRGYVVHVQEPEFPESWERCYGEQGFEYVHLDVTKKSSQEILSSIQKLVSGDPNLFLAVLSAVKFDYPNFYFLRELTRLEVTNRTTPAYFAFFSGWSSQTDLENQLREVGVDFCADLILKPVRPDLVAKFISEVRKKLMALELPQNSLMINASNEIILKSGKSRKKEERIRIQQL